MECNEELTSAAISDGYQALSRSAVLGSSISDDNRHLDATKTIISLNDGLSSRALEFHQSDRNETYSARTHVENYCG